MADIAAQAKSKATRIPRHEGRRNLAPVSAAIRFARPAPAPPKARLQQDGGREPLLRPDFMGSNYHTMRLCIWPAGVSAPRRTSAPVFRGWKHSVINVIDKNYQGQPQKCQRLPHPERASRIGLPLSDIAVPAKSEPTDIPRQEGRQNPAPRIQSSHHRVIGPGLLAILFARPAPAPPKARLQHDGGREPLLRPEFKGSIYDSMTLAP